MDAQYELRGQTFEWDLEKAATNLLKHGVAFEDACEVFFDPFLVLVDAGGAGESREAAVGLTEDWSLLFVVHVVRQAGALRIISARGPPPRRGGTTRMDERIAKRLRRDRPMTTISIRVPEDVIDDLKLLAPLLGFSGYQPLIRAYIGQGLRKDLARLEPDQLRAVAESLRRHGVNEQVIADALAEARPRRSRHSASEQDAEDEGDGEPGWLDHGAGLQKGFEQLASVLESSNTATLAIGAKSREYTQRIETARATQGKQALSGVRFLANEFGRELGQYGQVLSLANDKYEEIARSTQDSIEFFIVHGRIKSPQDRNALHSFVATLEQVEQAALGALPNIGTMRTSLRSMEGLERGLTRAARVAGAELDRFIGNIEATVASLRRGTEVGRLKLESEADG